MKTIVTWYGQAILNVDQRNEIEAHLRAEIADCKAKSRDAEAFTTYYYVRMACQLEDDLRALFNCRFENPNEGMLL